MRQTHETLLRSVGAVCWSRQIDDRFGTPDFDSAVEQIIASDAVLILRSCYSVDKIASLEIKRVQRIEVTLNPYYSLARRASEGSSFRFNGNKIPRLRVGLMFQGVPEE